MQPDQPDQPLPPRPENQLPSQPVRPRGNFDYLGPRPYANPDQPAQVQPIADDPAIYQPPAPVAPTPAAVPLPPDPSIPPANPPVIYPTQPSFAPTAQPTPITVQQGLPNVNAEPVVASVTPPPQEAAKRKLPKPLMKLAIALISLVVIIAAFLGASAVVKNNRLTPQKLLNQALITSFSSPLIARTTTNGQEHSSLTLDDTNTKQPLISGEVTLEQNGSLFGLKVYGSNKTTEFNYTGLPGDFSASAAALNTWVPVRQNGTLPAGISGALSNAADPRYQNFGHVVFGNFTLPVRTSFAKYVISHRVYSYNSLNVKKTSYGGKPAWAYPITENLNELQVLNESVAVAEGYTPADIKPILNTLGSSGTIQATLYVSPNTKQIIGYSSKQGDQNLTMSFASATQAVSSTPPKAGTTWQAFAPLQTVIESHAALDQSNSDRDTERKSDIDSLRTYIEKYQASTGYYPTLANLNDQVWVSANMQGIDPDVFKDPSSTTNQLASQPAVNQFAYQPTSASGGACDDKTSSKSATLCTSYALTATLSGGSHYTVKNLQ